MMDEKLIPPPEQPEAQAVLDWLEIALISAADDEAYRAGLRRTVPGSAQLYGVRVPALRAIARDLHKAYRQDLPALQTLADVCWAQGSREHRLVALFLLARLRLTPEQRWQYGQSWLPQVGDWETCDQLCAATLGAALAQEASFLQQLERWINDPNLWVRRAALVATVYLRRARFPQTEAKALDRRVLALAAALLHDPEAYVAKAVDWCIREVIKRHPALGRAWMLEQAARASSARARSTLKLAARKLSPADQDHVLAVLGD